MTRTRTEKLDLLQGTLDMMVLRTLSAGPANGYEIARAIERLSDEVAVSHASVETLVTTDVHVRPSGQPVQTAKRRAVLKTWQTPGVDLHSGADLGKKGGDAPQ